MAKKAKGKDAPRAKSRTTRAAGSTKEPASIYTMLLLLSVVALFLGCVFLFLEMKAYNMTIKVPPDAQGSWHVPAVSAPADTQWA